MMLRRLGFSIGVLYFWSSAILFGSLLAETVLLYPNIFHDVPRSLETASTFMAAVNPGDYFPPLGMASLCLGVLAIALNWRVKAVRSWFLGAMLVVALGDYLLSALYMWERNTIMFQEGAAVHSVAYLQEVAREFETAHWVRIGAAGIAAVCVFVGLLRSYRERVLTSVDRAG
ncbi:MAG: DUF1772 domain-containing protein [Pseudonocardiaceae bacterium]